MLLATRHLLPASTQAPGLTPPTLHTFPASQGVAPGDAQSGVHFPPAQRSPGTAHDAPLSAAPSQSLSIPSQISGAHAAPPAPPEPEVDDSPLELDELLAPVEEDDDDEACSSPEQLATRANPDRENATGSSHREEKSSMISPCWGVPCSERAFGRAREGIGTYGRGQVFGEERFSLPHQCENDPARSDDESHRCAPPKVPTTFGNAVDVESVSLPFVRGSPLQR